MKTPSFDGVFYAPNKDNAKQAQQSRGWTIASVALTDAYTDFMLSRQAMNCTPATLEFYKHAAGAFLSWCESQGITSPAEVTARYIRPYLASLLDRGLKDTTLHANARAIKTLVRFWHSEKYIAEVIHVEMPKLEKKRPSANRGAITADRESLQRSRSCNRSILG